MTTTTMEVEVDTAIRFLLNLFGICLNNNNNDNNPNNSNNNKNQTSKSTRLLCPTASLI